MIFYKVHRSLLLQEFLIHHILRHSPRLFYKCPFFLLRHNNCKNNNHAYHGYRKHYPDHLIRLLPSSSPICQIPVLLNTQIVVTYCSKNGSCKKQLPLSSVLKNPLCFKNHLYLMNLLCVRSSFVHYYSFVRTQNAGPVI